MSSKKALSKNYSITTPKSCLKKPKTKEVINSNLKIGNIHHYSDDEKDERIRW